MVMCDGRLPEEGGEYGEYPEEDMECDEAYEALLADHEELQERVVDLALTVSALQATLVAVCASAPGDVTVGALDPTLRCIQRADAALNAALDLTGIPDDVRELKSWRSVADNVGIDYSGIVWPPEEEDEEDEEEPE